MGGYIGARAGTLSTTVANVQDVTATDTTPEVTIVNTTHEDTDGGREGKVIFKGQQSGGEESTLAEIQGSHDGTADDEKGDLIFKTNDGSDGASPTERLRIDSTGKSTFKDDVGIEGATPTLQMYDTTVTNNVMDVSYDEFLTLDIDPNNARGNSGLIVKSDGSERMRIDSSGNVLVGKSVTTQNTAGTQISASSGVRATVDGNVATILNRTTSDGDIAVFRKDGSTVGSIGSIGGAYLYIGDVGAVGINFISDRIRPSSDGVDADNTYDFGHPTVRWDDIYATNGTIQTSDENEKQNIASLTSAEITAATAISKLFKTFKWKDKVAAKGDNARTHTGVVAQQVQSAMSDAGLDAGNYAFFISTTWWEKYVEVAAVEADDTVDPPIEAKDAYTRTDTYDTKEEAPEGATERTRMGIRYPELLAFIGAATEQRLTSIEARLTALEAE